MALCYQAELSESGQMRRRMCHVRVNFTKHARIPTHPRHRWVRLLIWALLLHRSAKPPLFESILKTKPYAPNSICGAVVLGLWALAFAKGLLAKLAELVPLQKMFGVPGVSTGFESRAQSVIWTS